MANKALIGKKIGMTQVWDDDARVVPVTVVSVTPLRVVRIRTPEKDGYSALQVTWGFRKARRSGQEAKGYGRSLLTKPDAGQFASVGIEPGEGLAELRLSSVEGYEVGQVLDASVFEVGDYVDVSGVSKGKGFAGGMERYNFRGQGASHGNHKKHRAPGSVGACATPARVFKGTRMAGRLGGSKVTVMNLQVVTVDPERELILLKGAVPGPRGSQVFLRNAVKREKPEVHVGKGRKATVEKAS
jgi:large subunit ribosomal protein L3